MMEREQRLVAPGVVIEALPREWPLLICHICERPLRTCDMCLSLMRTGAEVFYLHCPSCYLCDKRRASWMIKKRASGICIRVEQCPYPATGGTAYCGHHRRMMSQAAFAQHARRRSALQQLQHVKVA